MKLLLVGCGGYASFYVEQLLSQANTEKHEIVGIVDPYAAKSRIYDLILRHGIPVYDTIDDFYRVHQVPLAVICTPIARHVQDAEGCFANGSHVMLEKPIAPTPQQAMRIIQAAEAAGKKLAIGFQLCYDPVMLKLKRMVDEGVLGRPLSMRALIMWQRTYTYYARTGGWAGRLKLQDGSPVYDSILTNATAHYLMNMLWLTTPGFETLPALSCEAQLGRAYPIETFDTAAARFALPCGCDAMIYASHVAGAENEQFPLLRYQFENAEVRLDPVKPTCQRVSIVDSNGTVTVLGYTDECTLPKLNATVRAIEQNEPVPCPGQAALASVQSNTLLFSESQRPIQNMKNICQDAQKLWVPGLANVLRSSFEAGRLPYELGFDSLDG